MDFYDYLQNVYPDKSITFDRTDSFLLTKNAMCSYLSRSERNIEFALLQVCNTFWLFSVEVTKRNTFYRPLGYSIELVSCWKNYDKKRELIKLDIIDFYNTARLCYYDKLLHRLKYDKERIIKNIHILTKAIDTNDYIEESNINKHIIFKDDGSRIEKHIPLLKACGVAAFIDPLDIYISIEEYFSLEKQSMERTASIGITDNDKIEAHGFDVKSSFRGKHRR